MQPAAPTTAAMATEFPPPEIPGEKSGAGCSARNLFNNPSKFRHNSPA
jgi:hypothetical protein